ncbi:portal protein [Microcystis phage Mae-JY35]
MKEPQNDAPASAGDARLEQFKSWYKADVQKANTWRKESAEDFKFRDGDQYTEEEKQYLQSQMRPVVVFNRTGVLVDAVVGSEIGNRREVRYIPRDVQDSRANELLTNAAEWFRDLCDAEDEESEAFKDCVTAGMGWTETRLDYESNPAGEPKIERVDPMEMVWDCHATKANLVDSRRRWRVRKMSLEDAKEMFPDVDEDLLNAAWAEETSEDYEANRNNPAEYYKGEGEEPKSPSKEVVIVGCQYEEKETYYKALILPPMDPGAMVMAQPAMPQPVEVELDVEKHKIAQEQGAVLKSVKLSRKRVVQCFIGQDILKKPEPTQTGSFTWNVMTGLSDHDKGTFYGIVRRAKDPQRWANKWLSQMMHILNSQAKGGIMAEKGAFEDVREAEANWSKPEGITMLKAGALSGGAGSMIQPKPVAQFPAGFDRLMNYADEAIIKSTGINMEMLGLREVNQPGVLEHQRKQQGIAILATFFDGLRRYRKIQGRAMLRLIQDHLADGRLVRILGEEQAQYAPLTRESVADIEYDIIVDDSPSSPNEKERTWGLLMQMLPMFKDALTPAAGLALAKHSPLPSSLVDELKQLAEGAQQGQQQPDPMQQAAMALEANKIALDGERIKLDTLKVQAERERTAYEMRKLEVEGTLGVLEQQTERRRINADELGTIADIQKASQPQPMRQ